MKKFLAILTIVLATALSSCVSKRTVATEMSAEEYILAELIQYDEALQRVAEQQALSTTGGCTHRLMDEAFAWHGVPYSHGGHSKRGTDCSGFVMEVFKAAVGIDLPRNSQKQSEACRRIGKGDLRVGDLVFFATGGTGKISHVGLYVGEGRIIHASSSRGVMVSGLDEPYFKRTFHHAGRVDALDAMIKRE